MLVLKYAPDLFLLCLFFVLGLVLIRYSKMLFSRSVLSTFCNMQTKMTVIKEKVCILIDP